MLEKISLKNFKVFKHLNGLAIKPVTILCGTNSCGKSSILQSLLLLKQTLESQDPNQILLLNGRFVHLGAFENIIFEKNPENKLCLEFSFKLTSKDLESAPRGNAVPLNFSISQLFPRKFRRLKCDYAITVKVILTAPKTRSKSNNRIKAINVEQFQFNLEAISADKRIIPGATIDIKIGEGDLYTISWNNLASRLSRDEANSKGQVLTAKIKFTSLLSIGAITVNDDTENTAYFSDLLYSIYRINSLLQGIFASYSYIGPLREEPARRYIYENEITEIGIKGENAAYLYFNDQDQSISNHYFFDQGNNSFRLNKESTLSAAVKEWLDSMNIRGFNSELINEIVYLNLNSSSASNTRVSIADVGFGVSQIFPIILEGLRMPHQNTLLLEQPEIHLHPNLQMQLSDYFIALAKSGKKVMVETHSDHIVNRLVRRIVEDETSTLKDLISIYFFSATDSGCIFEEVVIDDHFGVTNWPIDFFDQAALEQESILKAGLKKRRLTRSSTKEKQ
jgi:predicted ATPase